MNNSTYDLVIIGGGPGGYVAALRGAQLGLKTALIEKSDLGGICLNWGCIPTKALLKSASLFEQLQKMEELGVHASDIQINMQQMVKRSRALAEQLGSGIKGLLSKNGVTVYNGFGKLSGRKGKNHCVEVRIQEDLLLIDGAHIVLATGARPRQIFDDTLGVWTSKEAMTAEKKPENFLIIGGGAIGIEFASFYNAIGSKVTLVELSDRIVPSEDEEIADAALKALSKKGINFVLSHTVTDLIRTSAGTYQATLTCKKTKEMHVWHGDEVLTAIGVVGNTEHLGLEITRVRVANGAIVTHDCGKTDEPGIYAVGDVAGAPWLAHKASHQGIVCIEAIAGLNTHSVDALRVPGCIYSSPQMASIGLSESKARTLGMSVRVGRFPFLANGQALAQGDSQGFVKVIFDDTTGELLGAHMIGAGVSELISVFATAISLEATQEDLKHIIFPHPTVSESLHEAILDASHQALHFYRKK